jgi:hypothetical protein
MLQKLLPSLLIFNNDISSFKLAGICLNICIVRAGLLYSSHNHLFVSYSSAKASELPDSTIDICLYGYIPCMPEVAISTGVDSDCTNPTC